jgi:hypothetical protein
MFASKVRSWPLKCKYVNVSEALPADLDLLEKSCQLQTA